MGEKTKEKRAAAKRRISIEMSKERYNETINAYLTDFIEDSKAKFEARKDEEKK